MRVRTKEGGQEIMFNKLENNKENIYNNTKKCYSDGGEFKQV